MDNLILKLKHIPYRLFKARGSGLKRGKKDPRNFKTEVLGWGEYKPQAQRKVIKTMSIKAQWWNTCQWNATTAQKEVDEQCVLSVRSLVALGCKLGFVIRDGLSNLDSGQKALQSWGIMNEGKIIETMGADVDYWPAYIGINVDSFKDEYAKHKIKTYWEVTSRGDRLKCIDDGHPMTIGITWYTGFNQGGGFASPWIITKVLGWSVGGHALLVKGYDLNYQGHKVYIVQNSYGNTWGDGGDLYIDMDYLDAHNFGFYANLDIPKDDALNLVSDVKKKLNIINMLTKIVRDITGGFWFVKDGKKAPIKTLPAFIGAFVDEVGCKTIQPDDLNKLTDFPFFGNN